MSCSAAWVVSTTCSALLRMRFYIHTCLGVPCVIPILRFSDVMPRNSHRRVYAVMAYGTIETIIRGSRGVEGISGYESAEYTIVL